jgi:hypothetical protein
LRAFKLAKSIVKGNACCCQHIHDKDCEWKRQYDITLKEYTRLNSNPSAYKMLKSLAEYDACQAHNPNAMCEHDNLQ